MSNAQWTSEPALLAVQYPPLVQFEGVPFPPALVLVPLKASQIAARSLYVLLDVGLVSKPALALLQAVPFNEVPLTGEATPMVGKASCTPLREKIRLLSVNTDPTVVPKAKASNSFRVAVSPSKPSPLRSQA